MLEELLIQNFQAHSKTRIEFDPNITCIVGPSDSGKSAIIRALRWVCCNVPGGSSFVRHGSKGTTVKLLIDGKTIIRKRSSNDTLNEYLVGKEVYKSFGRGIPEPVLSILNIDAISWQEQHDSPYWFNSTAGEVSRQLNAIIDLSIIDNTLSAVARKVHKSATKLELAEESEEVAKKCFADLEWVPEYSKEIENIEIVGKAAISKRKAALNISSLFNEALEHHATKNCASIAVRYGKAMINEGQEALQINKSLIAINDLITIAKRASKTIKLNIPSIGAMQEAIKKHGEASNKSIVIKKLIDDAKKFRNASKKEVPETASMENLITKYLKLKGELNKLRLLLTTVKEVKKEISDCQITIESIKKEMPEICPTCNQPLK